jgi:hypothetical protein
VASITQPSCNAWQLDLHDAEINLACVAMWFGLHVATAMPGSCVSWTAPQQIQIVHAPTDWPVASARVVVWPQGKEKLAQSFLTTKSGRVLVASP